eukprot:scaffold387942_cov21-Prasinocladus_malaysianus.AAC.1
MSFTFTSNADDISPAGAGRVCWVVLSYATMGHTYAGRPARLYVWKYHCSPLLAVFPPNKSGKDAVPIEAEDLSRLAPNEMLNDAVIDFYLKVMWHEMTGELQERCHFFNSHFYKKLMEKGPNEKEFSMSK